MNITNFILYAETVDCPGISTAGFQTDTGHVYSVTGVINAMVDIKLEKYFEDNGITETFDALKCTPGELQLRNEIRGDL